MGVVERKESLTKRHIIDVASEMVTEFGSESFRIVDLAERANVGVPTVYYHFDSRTQVIAEAQMANYFAMTAPLHRILSRVETALSMKDRDAFWTAVRENMVKAWRSGEFDDKLGIVKLLLDVWADPKAQARFRDLLDIQFARWVAVVNDARALGWIASDVDAQTIVAILWSASVGQVITSGSKYLDLSPQVVGEFCVQILRNLGRDDGTGALS
jgi:AcrR family transcriptional regulator